MLPPGCTILADKVSGSTYAVGIDAALRQDPTIVGAPKQYSGHCSVPNSTWQGPLRMIQEILDQGSELGGVHLYPLPVDIS